MININNISLNYYSFGFYGGLISNSSRSEPILDINQLATLAQKHNLGGIEIPFDRFYDHSSIKDGIAVVEKILDKGLSVFIDLETFNLDYVDSLLPMLSRIGIYTIRIKMDQVGRTIYGGNRYLSSTFKVSVDQFHEKLSKLMPALEKFGVALAIENHQDLHSLELVDIANKFNSNLIGITWDVGNSIAVGDTIESFYANAGHLIKNVHLKDYKVFKSSKGIRLVRCPLGDGIVNYANLFSKLEDHEVNMSIELGAQITRDCDINECGYWKNLSEIGLNKRNYMEFIDNIAITSPISLSNYEKGLRNNDLIKSEIKEFEVSVENLNRVFLEMNNDQ